MMCEFLKLLLLLWLPDELTLDWEKRGGAILRAHEKLM
jgi:hypothetical protein